MFSDFSICFLSSPRKSHAESLWNHVKKLILDPTCDNCPNCPSIWARLGPFGEGETLQKKTSFFGVHLFTRLMVFETHACIFRIICILYRGFVHCPDDALERKSWLSIIFSFLCRSCMYFWKHVMMLLYLGPLLGPRSLGVRVGAHIWAHMGPYGSSWTGLGRFRRFHKLYINFPQTFRKTFGPISHVSGPKIVFWRKC